MAAPAVEPFGDSFRTPNLFDASISADGGQIDSYFSDKMELDRNDCFDSETFSLFPTGQDNEDNSEFLLNTADFPYQSIATPPPSAREAPLDWPAFDPHKPDGPMMSNPLHQIDTTHTSLNARFDFGQATPPDDCASPIVPPAQAAPAPAPAPATAIKRETKRTPSTAEVSKPSNTATTPSTVTTTAAPVQSRRKKSSDHTANQQHQSQPKRRRPRKSLSAERSNVEGVSADPVEHERRNRFLERNRVAASKCRQKKKEWTQNLESHARDLHSSNHQLQLLVTSLKDEVMYLRGEMLKHGSCDCSGIRDYLSREADMLASGVTPRTPGSRSDSQQQASVLNSPVPSEASSATSASLTADDTLHLDPSLTDGYEGTLKLKSATEHASGSKVNFNEDKSQAC